MKHILSLLILSFSIVVDGQIVANPTTTPELHLPDSLTSSRFFTDSIGNQYMVEYVYVKESMVVEDTWPSHNHYIAICSIIKYKGNRSSIIVSGVKAIYSPVECASDCEKIWLQRLYNYQNKKQ